MAASAALSFPMFLKRFCFSVKSKSAFFFVFSHFRTQNRDTLLLEML
jgi:hypothetical protein